MPGPPDCNEDCLPGPVFIKFLLGAILGSSCLLLLASLCPLRLPQPPGSLLCSECNHASTNIQQHKYLSWISLLTIQGIFSLDGRDGSVNEISEGLSIGALGCCDAVCGHALSRVHQGSIFCSFSLLLILPSGLYLLHHAPYFLVLFFLLLFFRVSEYFPLGSGGRQQQPGRQRPL